MAYAPDGMTMIWSAMRNGQSDLYRYQVLSNNQRPLWTDPFDDLDPVISADGSTIWFASNRPNTDLTLSHQLGQPIANTHDLFALDWDAETPSLTHWVQTPEADERHPQIQSEKSISFLTHHPDGSQDRSIPGAIAALPRLIRPSITGGSPRPALPKRWKSRFSTFSGSPFDWVGADHARFCTATSTGGCKNMQSGRL